MFLACRHRAFHARRDAAASSSGDSAAGDESRLITPENTDTCVRNSVQVTNEGHAHAPSATRCARRGLRMKPYCGIVTPVPAGHARPRPRTRLGSALSVLAVSLRRNRYITRLRRGSARANKSCLSCSATFQTSGVREKHEAGCRGPGQAFVGHGAPPCLGDGSLSVLLAGDHWVLAPASPLAGRSFVYPSAFFALPVFARPFRRPWRAPASPFRGSVRVGGLPFRLSRRGWSCLQETAPLRGRLPPRFVLVILRGSLLFVFSFSVLFPGFGWFGPSVFCAEWFCVFWFRHQPGGLRRP